MRLFKRREDPLDFYRKRRREIVAANAEDLVLLYYPGMEHWSSERLHDEGEKVRALALIEIDRVLAEEEAYANT